MMLKMLTAGGGQTVSKHHQHPIHKAHEKTCIQSQAAAAVVIMDKDIDASSKDHLVPKISLKFSIFTIKKKHSFPFPAFC